MNDRARLYLGAGGDLDAEAKDLPHTLAQFRAQIGWVETRLSSGRPFLLGDAPAMPDVLVWFIYWFVRERYAEQKAFFSEFPHLLDWAARMEAIGHGTQSAMSPAEALTLAKGAEPQTPEQADPRDPQGLRPGLRVAVQPTTDSAEQAVEGVIRAVDRQTIAILREHPDCGRVAVHFPRVGYQVTVLEQRNAD